MKTRNGPLHDLPFFVVACMIHGAALSLNAGFNWAAPAPAPALPLPVELVRELPKPREALPSLAPMQAGKGNSDKPVAHGPGAPKREKRKAGVARKSPLARKKVVRAQRPQPTAAQLEEVKRREARRQARLLALEMEKRRKEADRQAALEAASRRKEAARQVALERKHQEEIRRQEAEARRRAFLEEQRRLREEAARLKAQRQAEINRELAQLSNADESISRAPAPAPAAAGGGRGKGGGRPEFVEGPPADLGAESVDPVFDASGREGRDALNSPAKGGGVGDPDGGPVSWSLEGPVGTRRLLRRVLPRCPDWVTQRGLDLLVQIKFRVLESGEVKDGVLIKRTSGFPELDRVATDALRRWKFQPYRPKPGEKAPEVWGVVTFRFVAG